MTGMIFLGTPIYLIRVRLAHSYMWDAKQKPQGCANNNKSRNIGANRTNPGCTGAHAQLHLSPPLLKPSLTDKEKHLLEAT